MISPKEFYRRFKAWFRSPAALAAPSASVETAARPFGVFDGIEGFRKFERDERVEFASLCEAFRYAIYDPHLLPSLFARLQAYHLKYETPGPYLFYKASRLALEALGRLTLAEAREIFKDNFRLLDCLLYLEEEFRKFRPPRRREGRWLEWLRDVMFRARYAPEANFANQLAEAYLSLGVHGTACLFVDDEVGRGIRYKNIPLHQLYPTDV